MIKLTPEEKEFVENRELRINDILKRLEAVTGFKLDDYLIAFYNHDTIYKKEPRSVDEPILNSYGLPKKFKVVHVDKNGIPYIKELNKNGKPFGHLRCVMSIDDEYDQHDITYQVDPDYEDSLIMGDAEDYEATATHKKKASLHKDITEHNKQNKINNKDMNEVVQFINSLSVNSVIWRSNVNAWTVTKINPIPRDKVNRINNTEIFMEVQDSKGKLIPVAFWDFRNKVMYKARPRTYRELRDT